MDSLWSMSTTVREAERILGFLKVAKLMEGETWNDYGQFRFQVLLVQHREYLNDPTNGQTFQKLNAKQIEYLSNPELEISYEMAESIIKSKNYVGGGEMRGRQSMAPLRKLGLVYIDDSEKVRISDVGNKFINDEITVEEFFLDSLVKIQYPNPLDDSYPNWNTKPFISILHLIRRVNELCKINGMKEKGLSKDEFGIFALSLQNYYDVEKYAYEVIEYRKQYEAFKSDEEKRIFKETFINKFLSNFKDPIKNSSEYADNMIRYFRQTKLIYIRGKYAYTYIDLEPRRKTEIDSILDNDDGRPLEFNTAFEWIKYFSTYGSYELPYETAEKLKFILNEINDENKRLSEDLNLPYQFITTESTDKTVLKNYIIDGRNTRTRLQNLKLKSEYFDVSKIEETILSLTYILEHDRDKKLKKRLCLEFEKWANIALNIFNDAILIKPNTVVGDDNEPINTAGPGVSDIECYYATFNSICEVTTLTSRDQWVNEGQPVMRHLREFENNSQKDKNYCLFIAPRLHQDTVNTFWNSVKYEYEGQKQKIIPITIKQLIALLDGVKKLHSAGNKLESTKLMELYESCTDISSVKSSLEWLPNIEKVINSWVNTL